VAHYAESQAYGEGMTCLKVKEGNHCASFRDYCMETCGVCNEAQYASGFAIGDTVSWTNHSDSVPRDTIGIVIGFLPDRVKVKFASGTWAYSATELKKAKCADSSPELVAAFAASQYFGEGMTCKTAKETNLCSNLVTYCADSCGFCGEAAEMKANHSEALIESGYAAVQNTHGDFEELDSRPACADKTASKVAHYAESQAYGEGMTCLKVKEGNHCASFRDYCMETCGVCNEAQYASGFAIGDTVSWTNHSDSVPRDTIGIVIGFLPDRVKVKFASGTWAYSATELKKAKCADSSPELVAAFAASQYFGEGMTCKTAKETNLCSNLVTYCADSCGFCGEAAEMKANHSEALIAISYSDEWNKAHGGWNSKSSDAHVGLLSTNAKCLDADAAKVAAVAQSAAYGKGMTCARARDEGHCDTLAEECKATCGLCGQLAVDFSVGDVVSWSSETSNAPRGTIGIVQGFTDNQQVDVKFATGTWSFSPGDLRKASCDDSPAEDVAAFAESRKYGKGVTCENAKAGGLCDGMSLHCARTCKFCKESDAL